MRMKMRNYRIVMELPNGGRMYLREVVNATPHAAAAELAAMRQVWKNKGAHRGRRIFLCSPHRAKTFLYRS